MEPFVGSEKGKMYILHSDQHEDIMLCVPSKKLEIASKLSLCVHWQNLAIS